MMTSTNKIEPILFRYNSGGWSMALARNRPGRLLMTTLFPSRPEPPSPASGLARHRWRAVRWPSRFVPAYLRASGRREGADVNRRELLQALGAFSLAAPLGRAEAVRRGLATLIGDGADSVEEWDEVVREYAVAFYTSGPGELLPDGRCGGR